MKKCLIIVVISLICSCDSNIKKIEEKQKEIQRQAEIFRNEIVEVLDLKLIDSSIALRKDKYEIFGDTLVGVYDCSNDINNRSRHIFYKDLRVPQLTHYFNNPPFASIGLGFDALQNGNFYLSEITDNIACEISTKGIYKTLFFDRKLSNLRRIIPYHNKLITIDMISVRVFDENEKSLFTFRFTDGNVDLAYGVLLGNQFVFVEKVSKGGHETSYVHSIDLDSLKIKWEFKFPYGLLDRSERAGSLNFGGKYLPLRSDSTTYFFNWEEGKLEYQLPRPYQAYFSGNNCYLGSSYNSNSPYVSKFEPSSRHVIWKSPGIGYVGTYKNYVIAIGENGNYIVILNDNNGKIIRKIKAPKGWSFKTAGNYVVVNNMIYQ